MTYYLLFLPGLVAVVIGLCVRRRSPAWGQTTLVAGCLICLGAFAWQVRQQMFADSPKIPSRANTVVGFRFANQIQALVSGRAGKVVVLLPATVTADAAASYVGAFSAPLLRGHPELGVEVVRLEPLKKGADSKAIDSTAFKNAVSKFPEALVYVSYAGVPVDLEKLFPAAPRSPVFFVYDSHGSTNWLAGLKQGLIWSVIVPRPDVDQNAMSGIAGLPGEMFDQLYLQATPANAESIAARLIAKP